MGSELSFGQWLQRRRRGLGLSQADLGRRSGYSGETIRKIESNERRPSNEMAERLADALAIPPQDRPSFMRFARDKGVEDLALPTDLLRLTTTDGDVAPQAQPISALTHLLQGVLVGRQGEMERLRQRWTEVQEGHAQIVMLSGEPGIGKTRLAYEFIAQVAQKGATVLRGGCYEYEATTPYLPFVEALRAYVRTQSPSALRLRLGPIASELARLAPEIDAKIGPLTFNPTLPPNDERLRLFDNFARFLASLAGDIGLLVFIDDLQWVDQATLGLLRYLLRNLSGERLLVLTTYRDDELNRSHPLMDALIAWDRERIATRIPLGPLTENETMTLLAALFDQDRVSAEFAEAIFHETEGNPFFTEEVVKSLIEAGQIYREGDGWGRKIVAELSIPRSIKEAIGRRIHRLSETCAETLRTAAALGKTFAFAELAAVSPLDEDALLDALDETSAAQLIRVEGRDTFVFTHDKIRETLLDELNPIRRRQMHRRIGERLEKLYAAELDRHAADLAHHFIESTDWKRGLAYSQQAAEAAERVFAHDEAIAHLTLARECAAALGDREMEAAVAERLGDVYELHGPKISAVEYYTAALELTQARTKRAVLKARIGAVYAWGADGRGDAWLQEAISELDPETQHGERARAAAYLGRFHNLRGQHHQAIELLEQALAMAELVDDVPTLRTIFHYLAAAYRETLSLQI